MVDVAQVVEPRIVIPVVVGSSPIVHPISDHSRWSGLLNQEAISGPIAALLMGR